MRNRVGRSKSSHDIWAEDSGDEDLHSRYYDKHRRSSERSTDASALVRSYSNHALKSRDNSLDDDDDKPSSSTASPWAKYLRSRYQNQKSSSSGGSSSAVGRSKSSSALYSRADDSDGAEDRGGTSSRKGSIYNRDSSLSLSYGRVNENPRTMYLQKRRMSMKIGSRGSDTGYFTWPRGVAIGPENTVVVADSSNHRIQVNASS